MSGIVVDASVALAWCFPDEASKYADAVLAVLKGQEMRVPAIWPIEVANTVWVGIRRKRIRQPDIQRFAVLLTGLRIVEELQHIPEALGNVLALARELDISPYDAAYLDVAFRNDAPLATLDSALQRAARRAGISLVKG